MVLREGLKLLLSGLLLGGLALFGNTRDAVAALFHKFHRCSELRNDFNHADRCGFAGVLYSGSARHPSGPDGRIAMRIVFKISVETRAPLMDVLPSYAAFSKRMGKMPLFIDTYLTAWWMLCLMRVSRAASRIGKELIQPSQTV